MNVSCKLGDIFEELGLLNRIAPAKHALPILSHILVTASDRLHLYATDLELGLRTSCPAEVVQPGTIALPAAKLLALLNQFGSPTVTFVTEDRHVKIQSGGHTSRLAALPTADFPQLPDVEGQSHSLSAPGLRSLIGYTRYAIDEGATKFVMKGALLSLQPTLAAMVATDSKRVAVATMVREGAPAEVILPTKTLDLLAAQEDAGQVELTIGQRHLFFTSNGRVLISRQLDATFPNYQRFIPVEPPHKVTVGRDAIAATLRRVGLSAGESNHVNLDFAPGVLDVSARSADVGDAQESVPAEYNGPVLRCCVNGALLLDTLNAAAMARIVIRLKDDLSPLMVCDGTHHVAVIATVRAGAA